MAKLFVSRKKASNCTLALFIVLVAFHCTRRNVVDCKEEHRSMLNDEALKAEIGRKLFFDKRLSLDSSISCSSCHQPQMGFADHKNISPGVHGQLGFRNAPTLLNVMYQKTLMFDAHVPDLEQQAIVPIQDTLEMGMKMGDLIARLRAIPEYQDAARKLYGRDFDAWVLTRSLAAFERTLISENAPFDRFMAGDKEALSPAERRGWEIFSKRLYCMECHPPPNFTNFVAENNGLYTDYGEDMGRFRVTSDSADIGSFKVPTLRNIELTYPYMHDGSLKNLKEVIGHYMAGGKGHMNQNQLIKKFELAEGEINDLISFLYSLTDTSYMRGFR